MNFTAALPQGLEQEGANELIVLGATKVKVQKRIVSFEADWPSLSRIHLYARLPFRLFRQIAQFSCESPHALYNGVKSAIDWNLWLPPSKSFRVDVSGSTEGLRHTHFSALQVKNSIVDLQRENFGFRSDINLESPDICLHLHLNRGVAELSLATSSESLHRRGYRPAMGLAPVKENLAAGLILKTGWNGSIPLIDPLCGSGTFLIEAASIVLGTPSRLNHSFLCEKWIDFDPILWNQEKKIASKGQLKKRQLPILLGCDNNLEVANQARVNIANAGFESFIQIQNKHFNNLKLPNEKGILICNPPYGKRIGDENNLVKLYLELGNFCKDNASGWQLWILNGNPKLSSFLKMKARKRIPVNNGGIDCRFLNYEIN